MKPWRNSKVIMISGGKGGVGKSTVAVGLAKALAKAGFSVGLFDADISGPSQHLLCAEGKMCAENGYLNPAIVDGVQVVSIGYLSETDSAVVWSEDTVRGLIDTLINQTRWCSPEIIVVDLPPSTSAVARILLEFIDNAGVIFVCTASPLSIADCNRDIAYHFRLETIPLGIIENLSFIQCHSCGITQRNFDSKGIEEMAQRTGLNILARFPYSDAIQNEPAMNDLQNQIVLKMKRRG